MNFLQLVLNRLIRIGDALSQLANVIFLNGHPNESLSGRAWRTKSKWEKVIDFIFFMEENHCLKAHANDVKYARDLLACKCDQQKVGE